MNSFELNKIIGAILGTLLFVMGVGFLAEAIYAPIEGRGPGLSLPEAEAAGGGGTEVVAEAPKLSIGTLLASANIDQGASAVARCKACHNFEEGSANKQGPALYGVVGRQIADVAGFAYGDALAAMGAAGDTWSYEHLSDFLLAPDDFAPNTKMKFGGLKNDAERANVIAYLGSLSASPLPYPPPEPAEDTTTEADGEAAAEGDAAVATDADAIETPTETQSDTPVEGTSTAVGTGLASEPEAGAEAPAENEVVPEVPAP